DYVHNWFDQGGRYLLAKLDRPDGAIYASLSFGESARGSVLVLRVVEEKGLAPQKIAFVDAGQMESAIETSGRVSLYGIEFDFDRAALGPDSTATLDEIAKLLADKPTLRLEIVGHTDDKGTPAYNMDLSGRRAAAVVAALVEHYRVKAARLSARGAGMT